jgi:hypothetical protein
MNYIDLLTQEEKPILCRIITGRDFKELFKRNEQEFSKIRKGFRAKSLTEQQALSIAIVNVDKPFIAMWVNTRVDIWLKEIQENIEELEEEGSTHDIALASTMLDSVFANNVDLYLKLAGKTMDADARSKLHERMESIKSERARNAEVADRIKVLEEEKRHLLDQIAAAQQSVNTIKAEYERKIQELEQDKDTLESLLAEAQERITELQTAPTAAKSDDADYLAQFDDTDTSVLPSVDSDEIVSLCGVISDYNGQKWLIRHASLMELFGWGGDKPRQCLRIGLQSHLRALQKHMVSCQTAPGTLICNLQACCGLSFLSAQWKWCLLPSRPRAKHRPSFHRYYTPDEFSIRSLFLVLLCRYDACAPLTKAAHYTYSLEFS